MSDWKLVRTATFLEHLKRFRRDGEFWKALDKKLTRLRQDPESVGGMLSGELHGKKSTRLLRTLRLIFRIDVQAHAVILEAIDHRKGVYD
ncbi:MAG: hypothetical protein DPW13_11890 [Planctomycetes bacterium]|nr:hypothetical protein [Planctomycetota bacterium]